MGNYLSDMGRESVTMAQTFYPFAHKIHLYLDMLSSTLEFSLKQSFTASTRRIFWKIHKRLLFFSIQLRVLANVRIFLGISAEKKKKNGASLPERMISTGYSWKSQGDPSLNPASTVFLLFSADIPRNILTLARALRFLQAKTIHLFFSESSPN